MCEEVANEEALDADEKAVDKINKDTARQDTVHFLFQISARLAEIRDTLRDIQRDGVHLGLTLSVPDEPQGPTDFTEVRRLYEEGRAADEERSVPQEEGQPEPAAPDHTEQEAASTPPPVPGVKPDDFY